MKLFLLLLLVAGAYAQFKSGYGHVAPTVVSLPAPNYIAPKSIHTIHRPTVVYAAPKPILRVSAPIYTAPVIHRPAVVYTAPQPVVHLSQPAYSKSGYMG